MDQSNDMLNDFKEKNHHEHKRKHDNEIQQANHGYDPSINTNTQGKRIFCPHCLTEVNPKSKLCPYCGKKLMFIICQNCGSYLSARANFCSNCGIKIK